MSTINKGDPRVPADNGLFIRISMVLDYMTNENQIELLKKKNYPQNHAWYFHIYCFSYVQNCILMKFSPKLYLHFASKYIFLMLISSCR